MAAGKSLAFLIFQGQYLVSFISHKNANGNKKWKFNAKYMHEFRYYKNKQQAHSSCLMSSFQCSFFVRLITHVTFKKIIINYPENKSSSRISKLSNKLSIYDEKDIVT